MISPWNFPFWMPFRTLIPQIALGNTVLFKPAPITSLSAENLTQAMENSGLKDVLKILYFDHTDTEYVISQNNIKGVAFTGSTMGGKTIAKIAGRHAKKSLLELGGSDPFIVLDDANVEKAAEIGCLSRIINNGQACINAKRFIIHEKVYDQFKNLLIKNLASLKVGDPCEETNHIGPLARPDLHNNLRNQVLEAIENGASVAFGDISQLESEPNVENGLYFHPMVLESITTENPVYQQELFGPVCSLYKVANHAEAIALGKILVKY